MKVERIHDYSDPRFSPKVLMQHGAYLANGQPCEVEIISADTAIVRGDARLLDAVIEQAREYAGHISCFCDEKGNTLRRFPKPEVFCLPLDAIQPSQFYADELKASAVATFIASEKDIIIPLTRREDRFISLDGHTRLYVASRMGFDKVYGFISPADGYIYDFASLAAARGILSPRDITLLPHEEYCRLWLGFCREYFETH